MLFYLISLKVEKGQKKIINKDEKFNSHANEVDYPYQALKNILTPEMSTSKIQQNIVAAIKQVFYVKDKILI